MTAISTLTLLSIIIHIAVSCDVQYVQKNLTKEKNPLQPKDFAKWSDEDIFYCVYLSKFVSACDPYFHQCISDPKLTKGIEEIYLEGPKHLLKQLCDGEKYWKDLWSHRECQLTFRDKVKTCEKYIQDFMGVELLNASCCDLRTDESTLRSKMVSNCIDTTDLIEIIEKIFHNSLKKNSCENYNVIECQKQISEGNGVTRNFHLWSSFCVPTIILLLISKILS